MRACVCVLLLAVGAGFARAGDDFAAKVRPVLAAHCVSCHGPDKQRGGLRLDTEAGAMTGGDSGPAVVAGKPAESLLLKLAAGDDPDRVMPPKGERLTADQLATLRGWVARAKPAGPVADRRDWWSLRPLTKPPVPVVEGVTHPIDAFVRATLTEKGLTPSPEADRRTLIRRVSFDLTNPPQGSWTAGKRCILH
jgi:mono/diheme cytochrome c family protein